MDSCAFKEFLEHFSRHCGDERPVLLLVDSVSSHVNLEAFEFAKSKGIEIYMFIPNATHIMQPLDKGVFGPLKNKWHQVVRRHTRENPSTPVGKEIFAELLKEAYLLFYRPLTVINSFKTSGIYPVDSTVVTSTMLKPGLTYTEESEAPELKMSCESTMEKSLPSQSPEDDATVAIKTFESVLSTPVRSKYKKRITENYDIEGQSPCFDVYRKLYLKSVGRRTLPTATVTCAESSTDEVESNPSSSQKDQNEPPTQQATHLGCLNALDVLASVACADIQADSGPTVTPEMSDPCHTLAMESSSFVSPVLKKVLFTHE